MRSLFLLILFSSFLLSANLKKVSLKLNSKYQFQNAGFIMAKEKGFYKELNLNVELLESKIGEDIVSEVLKGKVNFGISDTSIVLDALEGKTLSSIMAIFQKSPYVLAGLKSSNIKKLKDIDNKVLAIGDNYDISIQALLKVSKVNFTPHDEDHNFHDLKTKHIDLQLLYETNKLFDYSQKGIDLEVIDPKKHGFVFYGDIVFTSKDNIMKNQDMVNSFILASLKGWEYAFENIEESVNLIYDKYNTLKRTKEALFYEANKTRQLSEYENNFGSLKQAKIEAIASLYSFVNDKEYSLDKLEDFIYKPKSVDLLEKNVHTRLAKFLEEPLFEMNSKHIKQIFELFLHEEKNIKAIQVFDSYLNRYIFSSYRDKNGLKHFDLSGFPDDYMLGENIARANIEYKNRNIGEVIVYFDDVHRIDRYKKYLLQKKEIKFCVAKETMPYDGINEKGELIGLASDYFNEFSKNLNVPLKIIAAQSWTEALELIEQKQCDVISAMQTEERKKYLAFTKPYVKTPVVIATKLSAPFINDFGNLSEQRIGFPKNYAYIEEIRMQYPNIRLIEVANLKEGLQMVKDGKLYGQLGTLASIGFFFQSEFTGELKIAGKTEKIDLELAIGVRDDEPILRDILQEEINNLDNSFHNKVLNHWINIKYEQGLDYDLFYKVALVILIVLGLAIYNHFLLKRMNRQLQEEVKKQVEDNRIKERLMSHQSKLASMGQMINNIAHQWRQPLNTINSTVMAMDFELMKKDLKNDDLEKSLSDIELQTKYMSDTIESFRDYFKPDKEKEEMLLSEAVSSCLALLESNFAKKGVFVDYDIINDKKIESYRGELIQVIISILNNAEEVLENLQGRDILRLITIKIDNNIEIKDNGGGIDKDVIDSIFEPYFTTKQSSKGTGIGLYLSKMIIEESLGGKLTARNDEEGAIFTIEV